MCEWRQFVKICKTAPKSDILVLVVTFVLTVVFDLVVAIAVGMIIAVVMFMKRMGDVTQVKSKILGETQIVKIKGPMFFASADKFEEIRPEEGVKTLILDLFAVQALDETAARCFFKIQKACREAGVEFQVENIQAQPQKALTKAGFDAPSGV